MVPLTFHLSHTHTRTHRDSTPTPSAVPPTPLRGHAGFVCSGSRCGKWLKFDFKKFLPALASPFRLLTSSGGAARRIKRTLIICERLMTLTGNLFHASVASLSDRPSALTDVHKRRVEARQSVSAALIAQEIKHVSAIIFAN